MLIKNDAQCRVEEHLSGKMHMGFSKIKVTIEELRVRQLRIGCVAELFEVHLLKLFAKSSSKSFVESHFLFKFRSAFANAMRKTRRSDKN